MNHAQLRKSEWVVDDVLTAKLKVEVMPRTGYTQDPDRIEIPPANLGEKLLLLLDSGTGTDVTFNVQGETIQAHSQILSACSEVLQKQFACGLQESTTKQIRIDDCEPSLFRAFLRYLYSDSFDCLNKRIEEILADQGSSSTSSDDAGDRLNTTGECEQRTPVLQQFLALSHKYQLTRLRLWCEQELARSLSIEDVSSLLCQAYLYEAKRLESKCLAFINKNMSKVALTKGFASLTQDWPQVSLKISLYNAGVPEGKVEMALETHQNALKRKRDA